jgi:hypothetical protein
MSNFTAEMANTRTHECADRDTALSRCYGQIGISAVAAAVRYQGAAKNPAYAPAPSKPQNGAGQTSA